MLTHFGVEERERERDEGDLLDNDGDDVCSCSLGLMIRVILALLEPAADL